MWHSTDPIFDCGSKRCEQNVQRENVRGRYVITIQAFGQACCDHTSEVSGDQDQYSISQLQNRIPYVLSWFRATTINTAPHYHTERFRLLFWNSPIGKQGDTIKRFEMRFIEISLFRSAKRGKSAFCSNFVFVDQTVKNLRVFGLSSFSWSARNIRIS
jgi:hypothetical protein